MSEMFRKTCIFYAGDLAVRELRPDRFEVSIYDGQQAVWHDQCVLTLAELNKQVRASHSLLGEYDGWTYYRRGVVYERL